jgi:micrococcal nuclease
VSIRTAAVATIGVMLVSAGAMAQLSVIQGPVEADVLSVTDGDTLRVAVYPWTDEVKIEDVRVRGVDTPEIRGRCPHEKELAQAAKRFTTDFVAKNNGRVKLSVIGCNAREGAGFGRCLSYLHVNGISLSDALIENGLARENHGEPRTPWCPPS